MTLPADLNIVTVTGTYVDSLGSPLSGHVTFVPSVTTLRDPSNNTMVSLAPRRVTLDASGHFSINLPATNDPDLIPVGWFYEVWERFQGQNQRSWTLELPYTLTALDIADADSGDIPQLLNVTPFVTSVVGQAGNVTGAQIVADPTVAAAIAAGGAAAVTSVVGEIGDVTGAQIVADPTVAAAIAGAASSGVLTVVGASGNVTGSQIVADTTVAAALAAAASAGVTSVVGETGAVTGTQIVADTTVAAALAAKADDSDLALLVPYTGAAGDVNLGANSLRAENVNVNEGTLADPTVTDLGGLQVSVTSVDCLIRSDAVYGSDGWLYRATVPAAILTMTDNTVNHIYVAWNGGTPIYAVTTDRSILNLSNNLPVVRVLMQSGAIYSKLAFGYMGRSAGIRWLLRSVRVTDPVGGVLESGLTLSESATRVVNVAAGSAWFVLNHLTLSAIAQGGSGVTSYLLYHSSGNWTKTSITQYNNTQYDNGTDLVTLTNNRYAVNWVYRSLAADEIIIVLGGGDYSAPDALSSPIPTTPSYIDEFYLLIGRIIVQKSTSSAYAIEQVSTGDFDMASVSDHNDLDGLQGGTTGEYYHLTSAQYSSLGGGYVPYTGASTDLDLGANSIYADNVQWTEGVVSDPTITDAAGAAVAITSCEVLIRSSVDWDSDGRLYRKTVAANSALALTDNMVNFIYVTWNGGTPIYAASTDKTVINFSSTVPVARVAMASGNIEHQMLYGYVSRGSASRNLYRILNIRGTGGIERESGLGISDPGALTISIAAGYAWFGLRRMTLNAITSGVAGATMKLYYHSAGTWTESTITAYNNTQYDNGTNLVTLTANRYAVNWVYRNLVTDEIDIVLGGGDYTQAQAEASLTPAIPAIMSGFYVLCGRIIIQKSASSAYAIQNVSTTAFNQAAVTDHANLSGLQGGTTGEYYHLTSAQYSAYGTATSIASGTPASSGATGTAGQILYDATYLYICTATNTWKRITLETF